LAWVNGEWLNQNKRREMISVYREYIEIMDEQFPTVEALEHAGHLEEYYEQATELERLERIDRCENDTYEFALEYFSEARNPGNPGNWEGFDIERKSDAPDFHLEMTDIIDMVSSERRNAKVAVAAPRSHAKSTWYTKDFPIHQVVYRLRKYIIIISETPSVATANMEWIRNQLKYNEKLREDFGPLLSPKDQANERDNSEEFIAWHEDGSGRRRHLTLVQAASTGQALRGRNWNGSRPDLIICDDLEDARPGGNASTPEQREKLRDWFSQTVMALGDPRGERTAFVVVGTTVHFESLLMTILHQRSDFESRVYRAIIEEPERADLWEQCREIYIDRENPDRLADANKFYKENEKELLKGSQVLWGDVQPLYKLMRWKWDNGSKAFNTEYMNNPIDEDSMIFNPEEFTYWDSVDPSREFPHEDYVISMGVDFAMGKEKGDFSAVSVVAKHKEKGITYVVDSFIERILPDGFIDKIVEMTLEWQPDVIGVESVAAQEFFADYLKTELANEGYPSYTRLKKIYSRNRKELRIESMLPAIENKSLQFTRRHHALLEQFERYGQGGADDGIDSLEMAVRSATESEAKIRTVRRMNRWR